MKRSIHSRDTLSEFIGYLRQAFDERRFLEVSVVEQGKKRSNDQNAIMHVWFNQISREEREYSPDEVKRIIKLRIALPILRGDDQRINELCVKFIDPLPYEDKVEAMEFFPVTSLMKTKQLNEVLESMHLHYVGRVDLRFLDEQV